MTFEEFEIATDIDLTRETKSCFDRYNDPNKGGGDKPALLLEAQFYMQELGRREDSRIATRDFRMELIVIFLIGLELVAAIGLAIIGSRQQTRDVNQELAAFGKMQTVLSQLQESSAATAQTLGSEQLTMQSMNDRLGVELGRLSRIDLRFTFAMASKIAEINNVGNTDVELWGYKLGDHPARAYKKPILLKGEAQIEHMPNVLKDIHDATEGMAGLEVYVRDEFNNEFVGEGKISVGPNVQSTYTVLQVVRRQWSHK
jgi:hypothetical protein